MPRSAPPGTRSPAPGRKLIAAQPGPAGQRGRTPPASRHRPRPVSEDGGNQGGDLPVAGGVDLLEVPWPASRPAPAQTSSPTSRAVHARGRVRRSGDDLAVDLAGAALGAVLLGSGPDHHDGSVAGRRPEPLVQVIRGEGPVVGGLLSRSRPSSPPPSAPTTSVPFARFPDFVHDSRHPGRSSFSSRACAPSRHRQARAAAADGRVVMPSCNTPATSSSAWESGNSRRPGESPAPSSGGPAVKLAYSPHFGQAPPSPSKEYKQPQKQAT